ncbi:M23 family metallopeptidase [Arthrobacter sp. SLBN-53]|uniref:M23 family metallopeptidase n=1 Tax=Arthrobacter sp. SLBN-53 TaxID=2768412 RepID=UPI001153EE24|nr:M23 family metallopeptidase [Arthrobacter sp. SLBN-53]TQK31567.1 peptidase M23-like protein [Arthrobacter sp. SLBN-53]
MRWAVTFIAAALAVAAPVSAETARLSWPLRPAPAVTRGFDAPQPNWRTGHRGVDLGGAGGQTVYAAGEGVVVFAAVLAGRPLISVQHPGGLRTSYEPVEAAVRPGQHVSAGTALGTLRAGHPGCPVSACLHWGAMWGPAARADYVDPLGLLDGTPIVLKPISAR